MDKNPLPKEENIYETDCPILYAMKLIGQKWKLPILWYIADAENQMLRYRELERKVKGITATMLTKCLRELEADQLITRTQYNTIPPTVEYSLAVLYTNLLQGPNSARFIRQRTFPRSILCAGGRKARFDPRACP